MDPFGQVVWQRQLPPRSRMWFGVNQALLLSPHGLELIQRSGASQSLKMPGSVRPLGIIGNWAWFQNEARIYRLDLNDGASFRQFDLPDAPLAPPLLSGTKSLWLLPHELVTLEDEGLSGRYIHGLDTENTASWQLQRDHATKTLVISHGSNRWQVNPFPEQAQGANRPMYLNRAGRYSEALAAWQALSKVERKMASRELAIAISALGETSGWQMDDALSWVSDPGWRLRMAISLLAFPSQATKQHQQKLKDMANQARSTLVPLDPKTVPLHPSDAWNWIITGAGITYASDEDAPQRLPWRNLRPGVSAEVPQLPALHRKAEQSSGFRRYLGDYPLRLAFSESNTELSLFDSDKQSLLWQQRWETPAYLPGRSVALRQGVLVVSAGQSLIHVINPQNGQILCESTVPNGLAMPSQTHWLGANRLAILSPIGVNTTLTIIEQNTVKTIRLPQPAKWAVALEEKLLIADVSGTLRLFPDNKIVTWPAKDSKSTNNQKSQAARQSFIQMGYMPIIISGNGNKISLGLNRGIFTQNIEKGSVRYGR